MIWTSALRLGFASLAACYAALFLGVVVHEVFGHALVVVLGGGRVLSIDLSPALKGFTRSEGLAEGPWRLALDLGGLVANAFFGAIALLLSRRRRRSSAAAFALTWLAAAQMALILTTLFQGLVFASGDAAGLSGLGLLWRLVVGAALALAAIVALAWLARRLTGFLADQLGPVSSQGRRVLVAALAYGLPLAPLLALLLPLPSMPGGRGLLVRGVLGGLIFAAGAALGLRPAPEIEELGPRR